jgi:hypothetical protein
MHWLVESASKKLFSVLSRIYPERSASALAKAFWSFFSKKDYLFLSGVAIGFARVGAF